jgi:hypothetical protein
VNYEGSYDCIAINSDHRVIFRGILPTSDSAGVNSQFKSISQFMRSEVFNSKLIAPGQYFIEATFFLKSKSTVRLQEMLMNNVEDIFASIDLYEVCSADSECTERSTCKNGKCICQEGFTSTCLDDECTMQTLTCIDIGLF